jgi:hypothetical protein
MESSGKLVTSTQLSHGEQVEPWLESQESVDLVPPEVVKVPSVTSAEREECSLPSRHGEDGTEK